ncbi:uncharacterized protein B0I36DRAFT_363068 [Microdochium trichocladiopsis]|uniref:Uncharacterized protein n=1 Tax=Microdochium trichocladiopsis TaxID=1682393 RepID=A0A9P8Y9E9_9PEZI|nr:uncharacterized protein B0I36DRAFT_363068 [Microdochium trichocladiopsis]KAH7031371.1 hypothetical protein B0I36DRAFT_363068 [Microdochium trichocladiopsis]
MSLAGHAVMHNTYMDSAGGRAPASGVHPGMFRPPTSPSMADSTYQDQSAVASGTDSYFANPTPKRKRNANASIDLSSHWGLGIDTGARPVPAVSQVQIGRRKISRGNSRYTLAGEIATPGPEVEKRLSQSMDDSIYSDADYRRDGGSRRSQEEAEDDEDDVFATPLSQYTTAESRPEAPPTRSDGWGSFAFSALGGVVGKVWEFCKGGAFRGFHAGGGQGFQISTPTLSAPKGEVWCNEHDVPTLPKYSVGSTPGAFPDTNYMHEPFYRADTPDSTPRPAAKRRQISGTIPGEELRRNWVMVSEDESNRRHSTQPKPSPAVQSPYRPSIGGRRISRPVSRIQTPTHPRRQSSRASLGGGAAAASTASFASTRSPVLDQPPSRIPVRSQSPLLSPNRASAQQAQFPRIPSPNPYSSHGHRRSGSAVSLSAMSAAPGRAKKRESMSEVSENSPRLDKQARKLAAKRQQEERQTDIRINDFNARLQEMIRQGKEALGTTIEVDLDDDGDVGGWEDD